MHGSGDPFLKRFWSPCLLGWDQIQAPAGRAEGAAGRNLDLVSFHEAGWPKPVDKKLPGAVHDCSTVTEALALQSWTPPGPEGNHFSKL